MRGLLQLFEDDSTSTTKLEEERNKVRIPGTCSCLDTDEEGHAKGDDVEAVAQGEQSGNSFNHPGGLR